MAEGVYMCIHSEIERTQAFVHLGRSVSAFLGQEPRQWLFTVAEELFKLSAETCHYVSCR